MLTKSEKDYFNENGFIHLKGFFDPNEVHSIQRSLYEIIGICMRKYGFEDTRGPFSPDTFDEKFPELKEFSPAAGREIYDAAKQIFAVFRLFGAEKVEKIICELRDADVLGVAARGYGMRIDDKASEPLFKAVWHQEYIGHFRSLDGIVLWAPLTPVDEENGTLVVCPGSHKLGPLRIRQGHPTNKARYGNYAILLEDGSVVDNFEHYSCCMDPGDALFVDYLTLHKSGINSTDRPRWTLQARYFNFHDPKGIDIGWKGGVAAGVPLSDVAPELLIKDN